MSSVESVLVSRYLFSSSSLPSAADSTSLVRYSSHCAFMSAGMSRYSKRMPWVSSSHQIDFMRIRSTMPAKFSSAPIGSWITTGLPFRRVRIWSTQRRKLAPARSILLTNATRGTLYLFICRQTVSDWGCTPDTAQYTATAESSTRSERSTSIVKSTCPGVSMMLMRCSG